MPVEDCGPDGSGTDLAFGTDSNCVGESGVVTVEGTEPDGLVEYVGPIVAAGPTTVAGAPYSSGAVVVSEPQQPVSRCRIRAVVRRRNPVDPHDPHPLNGPDVQPAWISANPATRDHAIPTRTGRRRLGVPRDARPVFSHSRCNVMGISSFRTSSSAACRAAARGAGRTLSSTRDTRSTAAVTPPSQPDTTRTVPSPPADGRPTHAAAPRPFRPRPRRAPDRPVNLETDSCNRRFQATMHIG